MANRCYRVIRTAGGKPWKKENGSPGVAWINYESLDAALNRAFELAEWQPVIT